MPETDPLYRDIEKIDAHLHQNSYRTALMDVAKNEGFRLISINTDVREFPGTEKQREIAIDCEQLVPGTLGFIATFSVRNWGASGWQDQAIEQIKRGWEKGAVAVKIWKNIGMDLRDENGQFIMADHHSFDPVYEFLIRNEIPLLAHLGEPKNCWLPIEEMTVKSDRNYFTANAQFHMYLHEEFPSYEEQLHARDRVLARHKGLKFIGAHLASLEWSVDMLADWLDSHPDAGVDLAERVCHLQYQAVNNHRKVKEFVETYRDRIIYGSDQIDDGTSKPSQIQEEIRIKWRNEFRFFAGNDLQTAWNVDKPFQGLGLDREILKKLFRDNAIHYYPRIREQLSIVT
jgi:hypothetical protein